MAFCSRNSSAAGLPTRIERPITTTLAPVRSGRSRLGQDHAADRRAGAQARLAEHQLAGARFGQAVDVLQRIDRGEHVGFADVLGQRQLHQDAVDLRIARERVDAGDRARLALVSAGSRISTERMPASVVALPLEAT